MNWWDALTLAFLISLTADQTRLMADKWEARGRFGVAIFVLVSGILERLIGLGFFIYAGYLIFTSLSA